jgi:hypothetical protein
MTDFNREMELMMKAHMPSVEAATCERCGKEVEPGEHGCPYAEDIHGNYDARCHCCAECTHECAMDI